MEDDDGNNPDSSSSKTANELSNKDSRRSAILGSSNFSGSSSRSSNVTSPQLNTGTDDSSNVGKSPGDSVGQNSSPPAKKTPNDFVFGKLLGEGSFSSVYLAKDVKTGKEYAIKVCDKQHIIRERKAESIRREKEVLTILSANRSTESPFFVHLYATFQDSHRLYFVVTFAHGGELLKHLHRVRCFELSCCRFYAAEILQALCHLHRIGIVHRDLKPENILLNDQGHILVTDFGSAKILPKFPLEVNCGSNNTSQTSNSTADPTPESVNNTRARNNSFVGTAQYVSPEVLKGRYTEVGPSADLWAFGCILFQLVSGSLPFQANNEFLIFQKILKLEYEFPPEFPSIVKDLVEQLLKLEPDERLGAKDKIFYQSIQSHPFFECINFEELWQMVPPTIDSPASTNSMLKSQRHTIPENYEPGFDPRVIAERVLKSEQEDFIGDDDDEEDDSDTTDGNLVVSAVSDGISKLNVAGDDSNPTPATEKWITSSKSIFLPTDDAERQQRLQEQLQKHPASHSAVKGNLILKQGLVNKRKGLFARKRLLFLTEGPHLFYCEPNSLTVKGEIPWSRELKPEAKDFKIFFVHTPNRTYYLEDPEGYALEWCRAINEIHQHIYSNSSTPTSPNQ